MDTTMAMNTIENIEKILHEIEDGHVSAEDGIEEIHHIVLENGEDEHEIEEEGHDDTWSCRRICRKRLKKL